MLSSAAPAEVRAERERLDGPDNKAERGRRPCPFGAPQASCALENYPHSFIACIAVSASAFEPYLPIILYFVPVGSLVMIEQPFIVLSNMM